MARIVRREKRHRGFFGWIFLILFWLWNVIMVWWLVGAFSVMGESAGLSEAEQVGQALGGFIGTTMIFTIWGFGTLVLGLFVLLTKGSRVTITETVHGRGGRYDPNEFDRLGPDGHPDHQPPETLDYDAPPRAIRSRKRRNERPPKDIEPRF